MTDDPASNVDAPADDDGDHHLPAPRTVTLTTTQLGAIGGIVIVVVLALLLAVVLVSRDDTDTTATDGGGASKTTAPGAATTTTPVKMIWPSEIGGRPAGLGARGDKAPAATDAAPGVYLWNDFDGWHLWVVRGPGVDKVAGTITSSADILKIDPAATADANGLVTMEGKEVRFDFTAATAAVVGVDFNPGYRVQSISANATNGGAPLEADRFHVGSQAAAKPLPYTVTLTPAS